VSLKKGTNLIRNKMSDSSNSTSTNGHGTLAPQVKSQEAVISGLVEAHQVQEPAKSKKEIREERKRKLAALFRKPMTYLLIITAGLVVSTGAVIFMVLTTWVPTTPERYNVMIEVNSQILTALFTIIQFFYFPSRILYTIRFFRHEDNKLQKTWKWYDPAIPGNRKVLGWIIFILMCNTVFQFLDATAMWCWDFYTRPIGYLVVGLGVALLAPIVATIVESTYKKKLMKMKKAAELEQVNSPSKSSNSMDLRMSNALKSSQLRPEGSTPDTVNVPKKLIFYN
jgi:hypothetical protein